MLALDVRAVFDPAQAEAFLAALPARPAVVRIEPRPELTGARPLLLRTANLQGRLRRLLGPPDPSSKRINLREYAAGICFRLTGSTFEQSLVQWQHARQLWPQDYRRRLRLHPAPLVKVNLMNPYPRAYITRHASAGGLCIGPFASRRAAETFLEAFLDLFRIRRCQIQIRRDPDFPGCIYSEMKMCLAPCFAGCTAEEYGAEVARVVAFLASRGASLADELTGQRDQASSALDFERAAATQRRLEKVDAVRRLMPELVRRLDELNGVVLERAAEENSIAIFAMRGGRIADPFLLHFAEVASRPRPVEQMLREVLEPSQDPAEAAAELTRAEREDHLALLRRWFYARPREGEMFFAEPKQGGWPYRRILRACSRLLARREPETAETKS
jgi:excinuclease ABC subunit C